MASKDKETVPLNEEINRCERANAPQEVKEKWISKQTFMEEMDQELINFFINKRPTLESIQNGLIYETFIETKSYLCVPDELRDRFVNYILPNLHKYNVSAEDIINFSSETDIELPKYHNNENFNIYIDEKKIYVNYEDEVNTLVSDPCPYDVSKLSNVLQTNPASYLKICTMNALKESYYSMINKKSQKYFEECILNGANSSTDKQLSLDYINKEIQQIIDEIKSDIINDVTQQIEPIVNENVTASSILNLIKPSEISKNTDVDSDLND